MSGKDRARKGHRCRRHRDWFADKAHAGQKNIITRRWDSRGTRAIAPKDQRTASAYIFGAMICPKEGKGAAPVLPRCDTEAIKLHFAEIATQIAPGAHAALLSAKCPEVNPQENVWQFMCDNWFSNRVFKSCDAILDHCRQAWNKLIVQTWRLVCHGMGE